MEKRVFLIVLDSFGIGAEPDAAAFGDEGTNTLGAIANHPNFNCPNRKKRGLFNIDGVTAGNNMGAFSYGYVFDVVTCVNKHNYAQLNELKDVLLELFNKIIGA